MQGVENLVSDLVRAIEGTDDLTTKVEYKLAEIHLLAFKEEFRKRYSNRMNAVNRAALKTCMNVQAEYDYALPVLFANGQTVKNLFLYGIPYKIRIKDLDRVLKTCQQSDFHIDKIYYNKNMTSAKITCTNLASSVKFQCDGIMGKIFVELGKGADGDKTRQAIKIKPGLEVHLQSNKNVKNEHPKAIKREPSQEVYLQSNTNVKNENPKAIKMKPNQEVHLQSNKNVKNENSKAIKIISDQKVHLQSNKNVKIENPNGIKIKSDQKVYLQNNKNVKNKNPKAIKIISDEKVHLQSNKNVKENPKGVLPISVATLRFPSILQTVIKYLDTPSKLNLVTALEGQRKICYGLGDLDFHTQHERYKTVHGINRIFEDSQQFRFRTIAIAEGGPHMDASIIHKILRLQTDKENAIKTGTKMHLTCVDLRGAVVSTSAFEMLSEHFSVSEIKIKKTTGFFEKDFNIENVKRLSVQENPVVRLKCLNNLSCRDLTSISLNDCKMIQLEYLFNFIKDNSTLRELCIVDCLNIDKDIHMCYLLEKVFNSNNKLKVFHFRYDKCETTELLFHHEPVLHDNIFLEEIDLSNNKFIQQSVSEVLRKAHSLHSINLLGITVTDVLDFSQLRLIDSIQIMYHYEINESLNSLSNTRVRNVIINAFEQDNEENEKFSPNFIKSVIKNVDKFQFMAKGCKVELSLQERRYIRAIGAFIEDKCEESLYTVNYVRK